MATDVILHVGVHKSGTTAIQRVAALSRTALSAKGVLYPGRGRSHYWESYDLMGRRPGVRFAERGEIPADKRWEPLAAEIRAWPGRVLVSAETLSFANPAAIRRAVESLGDARIAVVVTARPLEALLPSIWQESVRFGATEPFEAYVRAAAPAFDADPPGPELTPIRYDRCAMRWASVLGPEAVTVVALPAGLDDPNLLFRRFCGATSLPEDVFIEAARQQPMSNVSFSYAEAEVMRRANQQWVAKYNFTQHSKLRRVLVDHVTARALAGEKPIGARLELTPTCLAWVAGQSALSVQRLADAGIGFFGDVKDLVPGGADAPLEPPEALDGAPLCEPYDEADIVRASLDWVAAMGDAFLAKPARTAVNRPKSQSPGYASRALRRLRRLASR
jgi:hypothetical protein